jgi:hypothetical protein
MTRWGSLLTTVAILTIVSMVCNGAMASTLAGDLPAGYSDSLFRLAGGTSSVVININALGVRDPSICASCNSIYTDSYTVNLFNQTGTLLESVNKTSYSYYNMFTSSHGIGAGPVSVPVPASNDARNREPAFHFGVNRVRR